MASHPYDFNFCGGINHFIGSYALLSGDTVTMGQLISTKIVGPPAMMELECTFAKVMASVDGFRVKGHDLTISSNGTV